MAVGTKSPLSVGGSAEMFDIVHIVLKQMERCPSVQVRASKRHSLLIVLQFVFSVQATVFQSI